MSHSSAALSRADEWQRFADDEDLRVRRRDLWSVARIWTLSLGSVARRAGPAGGLLLPLSGPIHLIAAALLRRSLVRRRGAAACVRVPGQRLDLVGALAVGLPVMAAVWLPLLSFPFLLPRSVALVAVWLPILLAAAVAADLLVAPVRRVVSSGPRVRHRRCGTSVVLGSVAAYPRGLGQGRELLDVVHAGLDEAGLASCLVARSEQLKSWYAQQGYVISHGHLMTRAKAPYLSTDPLDVTIAAALVSRRQQFEGR